MPWPACDEQAAVDAQVCSSVEKQADESRGSGPDDTEAEVSECCPPWMGKVLRYLGQASGCSAAGLLLVERQHGQVVLLRARPIDDLFLQAVQKRLLSSYLVSVGPAVTEPEIEVITYGDAISGPYEPPRSVLTAPILCHGRVVGMVAIASVFAEVFDSQDLCTLSAVAAQISDLLGQPCSEEEQQVDVRAASDPVVPAYLEGTLRQEVKSRVQQYVTSIFGLARLWQAQGESELPDVLRQDLDAIAESALQIRALLVR
jgi:hypothetical protein